MAILSKGQTFGSTEQITSGKLHALVDSATFVTGGSGTCETGGGLEVTSNGRLGIQDGEVDLVKLSTNNALNSGLYGVLDKVYPVGSIYISTASTNPDSLFFGGTSLTTWVAYATGRTLIGVGSGTDSQPTPETVAFTAGTEAGEYNHTLTSAESGLPAHYHRVFSKGSESTESLTAQNNQNRRFHEGGGHTTSTTTALTLDGETEFNTAADASSSHNNLQPYIVTYMWKRTA
jgi:hypothetical protein